MKFRLLPILALFFFSACNFLGSDENILAKVGDANLYEKDVIEAIPSGLNREDSLLFLAGIVNRWSEEQVMYQAALVNLPDELPRINEEIEKYKRTLFIFSYENELIKSKLDTHVSKSEIQGYFDENKEQFVLRQNILKLHYMIMSSQTKNLDKLNKKFSNPSADDLADLSKFCSNSAFECNFEDYWISLDDAKMKIKPLSSYLETHNLGAGRVLKIEDSSLVYLVKINELKINEDVPPLDFVEKEVKEIILNKRKSILLNTLRTDIINEAKNKNKIEVFLPEYK